MSAGIATPSTEASEEFPSRTQESPNRRLKNKTRSRTRSKSRQGSRTPGREGMYNNNNNYYYDDGFNHFSNGNNFNNFNRPPVNKNLIINTGQYYPLTPFNLNIKNNNNNINNNNNNLQPNSQFTYSQEQQQPIFHSPHYAQQQQQQQQHDAMYPYGRFDGMYVNVDVARNGGNTPLSNPMASPFDPQYGNFLIPSNLMTPYSATGNGHNASYFDSYSEQRFLEDNENNYVGEGQEEEEEENEKSEEEGKEVRHGNQGRNGDGEHMINNNNPQKRLNFQKNQYQNQDNSFFNKQNSGNSRIRNKFNNKMEILKTNKRKISNTNNLVSTQNDFVGSTLNENPFGISNELETCLRTIDTAISQSDNGETSVVPEIQFQYFLEEEDDDEEETGLSNTSFDCSDHGQNLLLKDLKGSSNFLMVLAADNLLYSKTLTNCIQFTVNSGNEKENEDENTRKNVEKNYILSFIDELHCLKFHNKLLKNLNKKSKSKKNVFGDLIIENCKIKNFINGVPINNIQNNRSLMIKYRMGMESDSDKDIKFNDIIKEIKSKISNTSIIVLKIDVFDYLETESFIVLTFANYNMKYLFTKLCEEDSTLKLFNVDFQHELNYSAMSEISNLEKTLGDIHITELKRTKKNDKNMYTINSNEYPDSFIEYHTSMIFTNFEILSPCCTDNELVSTRGKNSSRNNSKIINNEMRASGLVNRVGSPSAEQAEEINNVISKKVLSEILSEELNDVQTNSSLVVNRVSSAGNLMDAADVASDECDSDGSDVGNPSDIRIDICPEADDTFHNKRQVLSSGSSGSSNCDPLYQPLDMNGVNSMGHWGQPGPPPPLPMPSALGIHMGGPVPVPVQVPMHMSMSLPMPPPMSHATNMSSPMSSPHRRQDTLQRSSGSSSGMNFAYMENVSSQLINIIRMNVKNRVIFISNLPKVCRVEDVCNVVRGGVVQNIKYIKDKCFCFVTFIDPSSAKRFFEHVHVHRNQIVLHGYLLDINYGSRGLQLPPISNKMLLSLSTGACRNIYISLPEFSYKEKYINDAKYEQFQNKYFLPKEKVIRKDFTDYFGELEKINYLNDGHCCWVNFLNITHAIRFMEMLTNEPLKFHALFENRYLGLVIKYGKDRCANNFKSNI